jgi:hypothetical protein
MICPDCGYNNNEDAKFCKKCGENLKEDKNIIKRVNTKINILAVFSGLIVTILVLILGAFLFGGIIISNSFDVTIYITLLLLSMTFLGAILTGIIGCKNFNDGIINGGFLSLVTLVFLGFVLGVVLFVLMGIAASLASSLSSSLGSTGALSAPVSTRTPSTSSNSLDVLVNIIKVIMVIILVFISGMLGGAFGVFIKDGVKKLIS